MDPMIASLFARPWAIEPAHGAAFIEALSGAFAAHAAGAKGESKAAASEPTPDINGVRVLTMSGPMLHKPPAWLADYGMEYVDTLALAKQVTDASADPAVSSITIKADTPGGMVGGVHELHDAIAASPKPVNVQVDGMLASGGVWATAQADNITATKSSEIGSIGVYTVRVDRSAMLANAGISLHLVSSGGVKGAGADGRVTPAMIAEDARIIGQIRDSFVSAVSAGRGRDMSSRATGQVWLASDARQIGLIDHIAGEQPKGHAMDMKQFAALAAAHPKISAEDLAKLCDGKTDAEISAALAQRESADAMAAATAAADAAKAEAEAAKAALKAEQDKSAALAAENDKLKAAVAAAEKSVGKVSALANGAGKDPGPDGAVTTKISRSDYEKDPAKYAADVSAGKIIVTA